jgi:hypothetical protein
MASLTFGDTAFAAETRWVSAGDMEQDAFSEADGEAVIRGDMTYGNIEGSISYVIANNADTYNQSDDLNQLSLGASADFGGVNVVVGYQAESDELRAFYSDVNGPDGNTGDADGSGVIDGDETGALGDEADNIPNAGDNGDFTDNEIFGLSVGTTFAGADIRVAYATDQTADENSFGIEGSYIPSAP